MPLSHSVNRYAVKWLCRKHSTQINFGNNWRDAASFHFQFIYQPHRWFFVNSYLSFFFSFWHELRWKVALDCVSVRHIFCFSFKTVIFYLPVLYLSVIWFQNSHVNNCFNYFFVSLQMAIGIVCLPSKSILKKT